MDLLSLIIISLILCSNANEAEIEEEATILYKIEPLPNSYAHLGEGPHWDIETQSLYYVDIDAGKILRYDYQQNKVYHSKIKGIALASFIVPIEGQSGKFVVGSGRSVIVVSWDGVSETSKVDRVLFSVLPGEKYVVYRFNDGKADPRGRLFAGTMRYEGDVLNDRSSALYKYEKGGKVTVVKTDVGISNGLAWNEQTKKMYYIDTSDCNVKEYDYDFDAGVPSNPKVVLNLCNSNPQDNLWPDGLTIDSKGNLYVAINNGHAIYKVNPSTGIVLLEIKFPTKQITSAAWGGPNLDILYVTTSASPDLPAQAGSTYKVTGLGARGLPMSKVQL
ncbi:regucalcin-like isoform X3 [Anastrepha obliqua]|uniref:regucalcin-like isoform X3 n=1 Tax=Anastrepha obliqua TaxID=95512 RepID=UPI0024095E4B|nr:regucalcin-like isoform X3 [Anastrepha obliqua]